jgi:queuine tRNA-ribosyltransferase catalytic subunit
VLEKHGGLHGFMHWDGAILTDSGGFQMVSLQKLQRTSEEGVSFVSPHDGSAMMLTPEASMRLQHAIGADIMMQLDDVVSPLSEEARLTEATHRSVRWLDRCIKEHRDRPHPPSCCCHAPKDPVEAVGSCERHAAACQAGRACHQSRREQHLFAIVQGGLSVTRRRVCLEAMMQRGVAGFAIGGLGGGEDKAAFSHMISVCTLALPSSRPIYCMGIGYDIDMLVCVALGVDMFDCVFPTRTARFGHALTPDGDLALKQAAYAFDMRPIDADCTCLTCTHYSRAFLHGILASETVACHYLSIHNIAYQLSLMRRAREAILADTFPHFLRFFLRRRYKGNPPPDWVTQSLATVNIHV